MQTISSIVKELKHKGQLNEDALQKLKKRIKKHYIRFVALYILVSVPIWIIGSKDVVHESQDKSMVFVFLCCFGVLMVAAWFEAIRAYVKRIRLYTYGTKVSGKLISARLVGVNCPAYYFYYQFKTKDGKAISAKEAYLSGRSFLFTKSPFVPGQDVEVFYNPSKNKESTVRVSELEAVFNLKR